MKSALFALLVLYGYAVSAQNLIVNGGFETGTSPWFLWADSPNGYQAGLSISNSVVYSGNASAMIQVSNTDYNQTIQNRIWHVQLQSGPFTVSEGQELRASFRIKASAPKKACEFQIAKNSPNYNIYGIGYFDISDEWEWYEITFMAPANTSDIRASFHLAADTGTYYIDDVALVATGKIVKDDWYQTAETRIDSLRKGNLTLLLIDSLGNSLPGYEVKVRLKTHYFPWGTTLTFNNSMNADEMWYRQTAATYFNAGVFENAFKWPFMEPSDGSPYYLDVDRYLDWADSLGWQMRGHALIWGGTANWQSPSWVWALPPATAASRAERRISRDVSHYAGRIGEYDVVNEALHEKEFAELVGDSINRVAFEWARTADPDARLFINDFNIITFKDYGNYYHQIRSLLEEGAPIDGIGVQGHFSVQANWWDIRLKLDLLADLGLPIRVTEYDVNPAQQGLSEAQVASQMGQMMRIAFSHPAVDGFFFWGFWDGRHWIPNAGMFRTDKSPKAAADTVFHLIHTHWTTRDSGLTDPDGMIDWRGFFGKYVVEAIAPGGQTYTWEVSLAPDQTTDTLSLAETTTSIRPAFDHLLSLEVFPNPTRERLYWQIHSPSAAKLRGEIFDLLGHRVWSREIRVGAGVSGGEWDIETLSAGLYLFRLQGDSGPILSRRIEIR